MSTERITRYVRLVIDASGSKSGSREVKRALDDINRSVKGTADALAGVKSMLAGVFAAIGVSELARMADGWNLVAGRLEILEGSASGAAAAQRELLSVANAARADFESVATLYTRIGSVTRELGLSQRDNALATEALALSFRVAGATAAEASSASIQFTQSLASGVVRGEELNSLLDSNIPLVKIIAKEFGVTTGELKKLGEAGLLSTSRILPALIGELDNLRAQAGTLPETIGGAFTVLANELQALVGRMDSATGASDLFARGILLLADNLDRALVAVTGLAVTAIPRLVVGVRSLTAVLAANPVGLVAVAAASAAVGLYELTKQTVRLGEKQGTIGQIAAVVWGDFVAALEGVGQYAATLFADFAAWFADLVNRSGVTWQDIMGGAKTAVNFVIALGASLFDAWQGFYRGLWEAGEATFRGIGDAAVKVGEAVGLAFSGEFGAASEMLSSAFDSFDYKGVGDVVSDVAARIGANFGRDFVGEAGAAIETYLASVLERVPGQSGDAPGLAASAAPGMGGADAPGKGKGKSGKTLADEYRALENAMFPVVAAQRELLETQTLLDAAIGAGMASNERAAELYERKRDALAESLDPYRFAVDKLKEEIELAKLANAERETETELRSIIAAMQAKGVELGAAEIENLRGLIVELEGLKDSSDTFSGSLVDAFETVTERGIGNLIEGLATGKAAVSDFVTFTITELSRTALRSAFSSLFTPLMNAASGALSGAIGGVFANATPAPANLPGSNLSFVPKLPPLRVGGANGGDFMVPGGSGIDSRILFVTPGERVSVRKAGNVERGGVTQNITINATDGESAVRAKSRIARAYRAAAAAGGRYS